MDIIRKFYKPDLETIMRIWYDSNLEVHDFVDVSYWDKNKSYVSKKICETSVYVYEIDGKIVGFIGVEDDYIEGVFVESKYRGLGIGTKLINYIKEELDYFTLHVFQNNKGAVTFYEKMGLRKRQIEINEDLGEVEYCMYYRKPKKLDFDFYVE